MENIAIRIRSNDPGAPLESNDAIDAVEDQVNIHMPDKKNVNDMWNDMDELDSLIDERKNKTKLGLANRK